MALNEPLKAQRLEPLLFSFKEFFIGQFSQIFDHSIELNQVLTQEIVSVLALSLIRFRQEKVSIAAQSCIFLVFKDNLFGNKRHDFLKNKSSKVLIAGIVCKNINLHYILTEFKIEILI